MQSCILNCREQNGVRLVCASLNFVAAPKMPSYFCCFPICFSLPDSCDRFQIPLLGIFALKVLCRVELSRHRQSEWKDSFWLPRDELTRHGFFLIWIDKIECFLEKMKLIAFFSLKYSKAKFPLLFYSEKWRNTAEIQGKSNDSLLFT